MALNIDVLVVTAVCLSLQMVGCTTESWVPCGHISIPGEHIQVVIVEDNYWAKVEHQGNNVELKCSSKYIQQECEIGSQTVEVDVRFISTHDHDEQRYGDPVHHRISLTAPCFSVVCQWNPHILLRATPGSSVSIEGDGLKEYVSVQESDGMVNIQVDDRLSVGSQRSWIKIVAPIISSGFAFIDNITKSDEIYITQFLAFDLGTCTSTAKVLPGNRHTLSLLPLRKYLQTEDSLKADSTNDIHGVRVGLALRSPVYDKSVQWTPQHSSESLPRLKRVTNNPPRFDQLHYNIQFEENNDVGDVVTTAYAVDSDSGSHGDVEYSLSSNDGITASLFSIDPQSGVIVAEDTLDHERSQQYSFRVQAEDGGGLTSIAQFTVDITDLNDNAPTFQQGSYFNQTISEATELGDTVLNLMVIDEDSGSNGLISYNLHNNTGNTFSIIPFGSEARLTLFQYLDYESLTVYHLTLSAHDGGNPAMSSSVTIEIHVSDEADTLPVFNATSYSVSLPEDLPTLSNFLTVYAVSSDSPPLAGLHYFIVQGNIESRFRVDENTGVLTLFQSLDFERTQGYILRVQAQSTVDSSLRTSVNVHVTVENTNDHSPTFSRTQYSASVLESVLRHTHVVTVTAEDLDSGLFGVVSYSYQSNTEQEVLEKFEIDRDSGAITTRGLLDKELRDMFDFTIVASDGGDPPHNTTVRVVIRVTDVNDERPNFSQSVYPASVLENEHVGTEVVQVLALDSDSDMSSIEYYIQSGNIGNKFNIGSSDGIITTRGNLDREERASYTLVVIATDQQFDSVPASVLINITDVNDMYPIFLNSLYSPLPFSETVPMGSELLRVQAIDRDEGDNGRVTYTYVTPDIDSTFHLDPTTGSITLSGSLDYEVRRSYMFVVQATDGGESALSARARVELSVRDENDNTPMFIGSQFQATVQENLSSHTSVIQLSAVDADSGSNSDLMYSVIGDSTAIQDFGVYQSGLVYTLHPLDRERESNYRVTVQVSDRGEEPRSNDVTISVDVGDVIDYPPRFTEVVYNSLIMEDTPAGTVLVTVRAESRDLVSSVLYYITSGGNSSLFRLEQTTGEIVSVVTINPVRHAGVYTLRITAQHQHLSESVVVIITIMKDDGVPRLEPLSVYFNVFYSDLSVLNHLGRVQISQPKDSLNYTFSLRNSDTNVRRYFMISESNGDISTFQNVLTGDYRLNVTVTSPTGMGHGLVEVYVRVVTNSTLANSVVATFVGVREASFVSLQLEQFSTFLSETIPCSRDQVELFSLATVGEERIQLAFAIRDSTSRSYIDPSTIVDLVQANAHTARPSTFTELATDLCANEPCPNLQLCQPVVELTTFSPAVPYRVLPVGERVYISQPFTWGHTCYCPVGYSRDDLCTSAVDLCDPSPCQFGAVCVDNVNDYYCECSPGTRGKNCSTVCPSTSCDPCTPSPCLHDGVCSVPEQNPAHHTCSSCPWESKYSGPNCELTSLSFEQGSFVAFPKRTFSADVKLSFRFASVVSSGLLLYSGRDSGYHDYIAVELVIGQIQVGVSYGGVPTTVRTESLWQLNNAEWHDVEIELRNRELFVRVSGCGSQFTPLDGAEEVCHMTTQLLGDMRTLDLTTPLYIGGLESHIRKSEYVSSTSYTGCIGQVVLGGSLLDFSAPLRSQGVGRGCDPLDVECSSLSCLSGECVTVWNGTVCSCEGESPTCQDGTSAQPVQLIPGYIDINLISSSATLTHFSLAFRTRSSNAVLVRFGSAGSLEVKQGSIQFRRNHNSALMVTAITVAADANANDGYWHTLTLSLTNTYTQLSLDVDRIVARSPEGGSIQTQFIRLGAEEPSVASSRFIGCLGNLVINSQRLDLASGLESSPTGYNITHGGVASGCGNGAPCERAECPAHSTCVSQWRDYSCVCDFNNQFRVVGDECVTPCTPNPCRNGRVCSLTPLSSPALFQCVCESGDCEDQQGLTCAVGFYGPPQCQPCRCDTGGVVEGVCDGVSGECLCKSDGDYYGRSGDLGCRSCDCHVLGSTSLTCDENTGQCDCKRNVIGRTCDRCAIGFAGMDDQGCKEATVVFGGFSLVQEYSIAYKDQLSQVYLDLTNGLASSLDQELYLFGLPGRFASSVSRLVNSSGAIGIEYQVSNYFPRNSSQLPHPSVNTLASAVQVIVQSGWAGPYQIVSHTHSLPESCSQFPAICVGCPEGMIQDGIICRPASTCARQDDLDRDGIPDVCDNCSLTFNPNQDPSACVINKGVCPVGVASDVLWSSTYQGTSDIKPCQLPSVGYATRYCEVGGVWGEVDTLTCVSLQGQELLAQANALSSGELPSLQQLSDTLLSLVTLTGGHPQQLTGGDIQATGKLLSQLLTVLQGYHYLSPGVLEIRRLLQNYTLIASNLLAPMLSSHWSTPIRDAGFSAVDFMASLEQLFIVSGLVLEEETSLTEEQLLITSFGGNSFPLELDLELGDKSALVSLPGGLTTPTTRVTMAMISNLGLWLQQMYTFNVSTINFTVATPLLSVQAVDGVERSEVTNLAMPINITLPYRAILDRPEGIDHAHCVSWVYGRGWSNEGCLLIDSNHTHTTCTCSHLTIFSVLLPESAFQPLPPPPPLGYTPEIFTYAVLGVVCLLLLTTFLVLVCLPSTHSLQTTVHMNLLVSLLAATVVFLVGINRVEIAEVCVSLGILLMFLILSSMSWLVADALVIARFLLNPPPRKNFVVYLIIVGWLLPVFLCGIPMGTVGIVSESFVEDLGHPNYCWLSPRVVYAFIAPIALLILLYAGGVIFSFVMLSKLKSGEDSTRVGVVMNKHKVRMALFVSMATTILLVVTWTFGLLSIYVEKFLEYPFAIFYAMLAVFLFLVLCFNSQVREACKAKVSNKDDLSSLEATITSSSLIGRVEGTCNYADIDLRHTHHHGHHHHPVVSTSVSHSHHHHSPHNQHRHHRDSPQVQRGFHNELSSHHQQYHTHHNTSTLTQMNMSERDVAKKPHPSRQSPSLSPEGKPKEGEKEVWFEFPDPTPLSPLTFASESGSVRQEVREPVYSQINKSHGRRRESHDPLISSHDTVLESPDRDDVTDIDHATSPSLSEIYERGRGTGGESPQSYLEYTSEVATPPPLQPATARKEDPLWYRPRDSGCHFDMSPLPYEIIQSPARSDQEVEPDQSTITTSTDVSFKLNENGSCELTPKQRSMSDDPLSTSHIQRSEVGVVSCQSSSSSPGSRRLSSRTRSSHTPPTSHTPLSSHTPPTSHIPLSSHTPPTSHIPLSSHTPPTSHIPLSSHTPPTSHTPLSSHTPPTSHIPLSSHTPPTSHIPLSNDRLPSLSLAANTSNHEGVTMATGPNMSPRKHHDIQFQPLSTAGMTFHPSVVHSGRSDVSTSQVSSRLPSSLQCQVGRGEKVPGGCGIDKDIDDEQEGQYHSDGPRSVKEGDSHVIRHADGSETVQSLV